MACKSVREGFASRCTISEEYGAPMPLDGSEKGARHQFQKILWGGRCWNMKKEQASKVVAEDASLLRWVCVVSVDERRNR